MADPAVVCIGAVVTEKRCGNSRWRTRAVCTAFHSHRCGRSSSWCRENGTIQSTARNSECGCKHPTAHSRLCAPTRKQLQERSQLRVCHSVSKNDIAHNDVWRMLTASSSRNRLADCTHKHRGVAQDSRLIRRCLLRRKGSCEMCCDRRRCCGRSSGWSTRSSLRAFQWPSQDGRRQRAAHIFVPCPCLLWLWHCCDLRPRRLQIRQIPPCLRL